MYLVRHTDVISCLIVLAIKEKVFIGPDQPENLPGNGLISL